MQDTIYLVLSAKGVRRMTKGGIRRGRRMAQPALGAGERAVLVRIEVPDSAFRPAPTPEATLTIPEHALRPLPMHVQLWPDHEPSEG